MHLIRSALRRAVPVLVCAAAVAAPHAVAAQTSDASPAPAHIAVVDGSATIERDGRVDQAVVDMPIIAGDRLRTDAGRIEVLFPDGSALDMDGSSILDLQADTRLRLTAGRILLTVAGAENPAAALRYQIDTPAATAQTFGPGEYRIALTDATPPETELDVLRGSGTLATERGSVALDAGYRSVARRDEAPSYAEAFNSARADDFDAWTGAERDARLGSAASAEYLPPDLQTYSGTFDQYGSWDYMQPYGYVWYPSVSASWRPYYHGYWSPIRQYGWTWIGLDAWSWPTHHFGRWGYAHGAWFWIPARRWAPAWVAWGAAPGYVSWCPLGWDGRAVFGLSSAVHERWRGWTVIPRDAFKYSFVRVSRNAVAAEPDRFQTTPFIEQGISPVAIPRHPIAVAVARPSVVERSVSARLSARPDARSSSSPPSYTVPRGSVPQRPGVVPLSPAPVAVSPHDSAAAPISRTPTYTVPPAQRRAPASPSPAAPVIAVPRATRPSPTPTISTPRPETPIAAPAAAPAPVMRPPVAAPPQRVVPAAAAPAPIVRTPPPAAPVMRTPPAAAPVATPRAAPVPAPPPPAHAQPAAPARSAPARVAPAAAAPQGQAVPRRPGVH